MKIAVSSTGTSLDSQVDPRFGRCQYFIIVDTETMDFEVMENPNVMAMGGAGIQSAQLVANKGAEVVLTGNCGPNAFQTFAAAGVNVVVGVVGTIKDVVERYKQGELQPVAQPNVASHFGMAPGAPQPPGMSGGPGTWPGPGGGFGMGGGRGMGRGRGRGMGAGFGMGPAPQPKFPGPPAAGPGQDDLGTLVKEMEALRKQLREINQRLERLEKKKQ